MAQISLYLVISMGKDMTCRAMVDNPLVKSTAARPLSETRTLALATDTTNRNAWAGAAAASPRRAYGG